MAYYSVRCPECGRQFSSISAQDQPCGLPGCRSYNRRGSLLGSNTVRSGSAGSGGGFVRRKSCLALAVALAGGAAVLTYGAAELVRQLVA